MAQEEACGLLVVGGGIVGLRAFDDVALDAPDDDPAPPTTEATRRALTAPAARLPSSRGATAVAGRAGQLDMTPDGRPLLGPDRLMRSTGTVRSPH